MTATAILEMAISPLQSSIRLVTTTLATPMVMQMAMITVIVIIHMTIFIQPC